MVLTITFRLGWYVSLKIHAAICKWAGFTQTCTHSHVGSTCYKKLKTAALNSIVFSKRLVMFLKYVSLCLDPGKSKAIRETKKKGKEKKKRTMNSKSTVFQLKKLQLIWEVAEHISCFQFYSSKIFHSSLCICLASHITVTHQSPQELGF